MRYFLLLAIIMLLCACSPQSVKVSMEQINAEETTGNFTAEIFIMTNGIGILR